MKPCITRHLLPLTILLLTAGCASIPGYMMTQINVDAEEPFLIFKQNENPKWSVGSHVMLADISSNRLALTYLPGGELGGPAVYSWPAYSDDKGLTWSFGDPFGIYTNGMTLSQPLFVEEGDKFPKYYHGVFFSGARFSDGERVFFQSYEKRGRYTMFLQMRSYDDGVTWEYPQHMTIGYPEGLKFEPDYIALAPLAAVTPDDTMYVVAGLLDRGKIRLTTALYKSTDRGRSLNPVGVVAEYRDARFGKMPHGPGEPAILALSSNELICVMRTGTRQGTAGISINVEAEDMLLSRSLDAGKTWKHKRINVQGVMPKLYRMSNGIIVLATGRPGNRIYFSVDGGQSWGGEISLTPYKYMSSGYMDIKEVEPGKLLVVYDLIRAPLAPEWREDDGEEKESSIKRAGKFMYDFLIGSPEEDDENGFNQIIGRYIHVTPR